LPLTDGLEQALRSWDVLPALSVLPPAPALVAEATRRAGVIWLTVPGRRAYPVWHIWRAVAAPGQEPPPPGAAYLVTGPGEQPAPGLAESAAGPARVLVTVPSKESGGALVTWTADVRRVNPATAEWDVVTGSLAAGRLNATVPPGDAPPAARWAREGAVFCLSPVGL
jgi:hypothetical protein